MSLAQDSFMSREGSGPLNFVYQVQISFRWDFFGGLVKKKAGMYRVNNAKSPNGHCDQEGPKHLFLVSDLMLYFSL